MPRQPRNNHLLGASLPSRSAALMPSAPPHTNPTIPPAGSTSWQTGLWRSRQRPSPRAAWWWPKSSRQRETSERRLLCQFLMISDSQIPFSLRPNGEVLLADAPRGPAGGRACSRGRTLCAKVAAVTGAAAPAARQGCRPSPAGAAAHAQPALFLQSRPCTCDRLDLKICTDSKALPPSLQGGPHAAQPQGGAQPGLAGGGTGEGPAHTRARGRGLRAACASWAQPREQSCPATVRSCQNCGWLLGTGRRRSRRGRTHGGPTASQLPATPC